MRALRVSSKDFRNDAVAQLWVLERFGKSRRIAPVLQEMNPPICGMAGVVLPYYQILPEDAQLPDTSWVEYRKRAGGSSTPPKWEKYSSRIPKTSGRAMGALPGRKPMKSRIARILTGLSLLSLAGFWAGCANSSNNNQPPTPQNGTVTMMISDQSTEDWSVIGVRVLSVSLTPQGGGSDVTVYTAPSPAPYINLLQLDQLGEILGNASIPADTYTAATITVSGNSSDVLLTASSDPETGFAGTPGATIPSSQIQVLGTQGSAGNLTVPVKVKLEAPLVVTANRSNALDLEFDLSHPAFIIGHTPPVNSGTTLWAVNFNGPIRHHRIFDLRRFILREHYATVTGVNSGNTALMVTKDYPVYPPTNPETAINTSQQLTLNVDSANGTLFYDVDAKTRATLTDFSSIASTIGGKFIRFTGRFQVDGSLTAVRIWASTDFNKVWISPEGHVLHSNAGAGTLTVENELGKAVTLTVDANTQFFFQTPASIQSSTTPIGTGPAFLSNIVRGFKVHVSCVDPLAAPLVAQTVDIEIARYDGAISNASLTDFTYNRVFHTASDDYTVTLPYILSSTANGNDPATGAAITGYKWWNFTFPTIVDSGANAISDFMNATNGGVNFGGSVGQLTAAGVTYATWNDPTAANTWAAPWTVLLPTDVPFGLAATSYSNSTGSFTMTVTGGTSAVPVDLNTTTGSATLVYQVDRTNGIVTVSPVDISTTAGQDTLTTNLVTGTPVKVFGIPQPSGSIKTYVLVYFTGVLPTAVS